jgi:dihydroxyacid dehydratase/phosphogluconate dehydratase
MDPIYYSGCDKNIPGSVMAIGRLNRPAIVILYGGRKLFISGRNGKENH